MWRARRHRHALPTTSRHQLVIYHEGIQHPRDEPEPGVGLDDSWLVDPLCIAVRSASAAGITVVVAAGNFRQVGRRQGGVRRDRRAGQRPSVITVGAVNIKGTIARSDVVSVTLFSSRGPTRGGALCRRRRRAPHRQPDQSRTSSRRATASSAPPRPPRRAAGTTFLEQLQRSGRAGHRRSTTPESVMVMSGTSIAAPVVAGAALLLQANPGLTPPLVKAILQYTAQPIAGASLAHRGAGQINVDGALALAAPSAPTSPRRSRRPSSPAATCSLPARRCRRAAPRSTATATWSRIVFAGGNRVLSGDALFAKVPADLGPAHLAWANGGCASVPASTGPPSSTTPAGTFVVVRRCRGQPEPRHRGRGGRHHAGRRQLARRQDRRVHAGRHAGRLAGWQRQRARSPASGDQRAWCSAGASSQRGPVISEGLGHQRRAGDQRGPGHQTGIAADHAQTGVP